MTPEVLCRRYLAALDAGDLAAVTDLFAPDAVVVSPLYGTGPAAAFYADLFTDTQGSQTELLNIFPASTDGAAVALHFRYVWTLASGKVVDFEVVDVIELAEEGDRFAKITIIYDTAPLRADFDAARVST